MSNLPRSKGGGLRPIFEIGAWLGLLPQELISYGSYKAKVSLSALARLAMHPMGRSVLVTAMNPTPFGEGKTTIAIGLAMGLCQSGKRAVVTLRQPSLGPVFGVKGGGTGGGKAQVLPMEEINLHLTADAHAVAASHNLLSAFLDNHLFHGNALEIDPTRMTWPRAMGISDRGLRQIRLGAGEGGETRQGQFVITEASEVMAILALATNLADLRRRLGRILAGITTAGQPITAEDLHCAGAMAALLKDALCPNLVQTSEGTPAFVHTGPFGNIAHGASSILADAIALRCAEYVVTEAGFGSDLGAEKFFHIKCRASGFRPDAAVVVGTLRAIKLHGNGGAVRVGGPLPLGLTGPNREAVKRGLANLEHHIGIVRAFGVPVVVAINAYREDPPDELAYVLEEAVAAGAVQAVIATPWADGGKGAETLAEAVIEACAQPGAFAPLYSDCASIKEKIGIIATRIYGAAGIRFTEEAEAQVNLATKLGFSSFPICMAKTPLSLSHDPTLKGRPSDFTLPIQGLRILAGAEFLTAVCSGIQLMPGLPRRPAGERIDLDTVAGEIVGLS